jgi:hypothetical protein
MKVIMQVLQFCKALVWELSDEAAYRRFLAAAGREPSQDAWRAFTDQRYRRKYQNAKCC